MKLQISLSFLFVLGIGQLSAQTPANLTRDTSLANTYLRKVTTLPMPEKEKLILAGKALALYEGHPQLPEYVLAQSHYAYALFPTDGEKARDMADAAIAMGTERFGTGSHPHLAAAYLTLMKYEQDYRMDNQRALAYGLAASPFLRSPGAHYFELQYGLSFSYERLSDETRLKQQLDEWEEALQQVPPDDFSHYRAELYEMLAIYHYMYTSNYEKARLYGEKAYSLLAPDAVASKSTVAMILVWVFVEGWDDLDQANQWLEVVMENESRRQHRTIAQKGQYASWLGSTYLKLEQLEAALEQFQEAMEIYRQDTMLFKDGICECLREKGFVYFYLGDMEKAITFLKKSLDCAPDDEVTHIDLASIMDQLDDPPREEILYHLQKGITLLVPGFSSMNIEDNPPAHLTPTFASNAYYALWVKGQTLYDLYALSGNLTTEEKKRLLNSALGALERAIQYREKPLDEFEGYEEALFKYNKRTTLMYGQARLALYGLYELEPSKELFDQIYFYTEKRKVMSLIESLSPSKLPEALVSEEIALRKELLQMQLKAATVGTDSLDHYEKEMFRATHQLDAYQAMIKRDYPRESDYFYHIPYATPDDIAAQLDDETLFLSIDAQYFGIYGDRINITAIGKNERKVLQSRQDSVFRYIWDLEKLNKNPLLVQKKNRQKYIHHCHQLYKMLIEPLKEELEGKTKLIIVQEGHLLRVPFDILLASGEDKPFHELDYLIHDYDISYHYSGTTYLQLKKKPAIHDHSLLAFAPVFNEGQGELAAVAARGFLVDSLHRSIEGGKFIPLPNSKKEVETITALVGPNSEPALLLQQNATKENLLTALAAKPYQFVHLASHGLVNMEVHHLSGLACWHEGEGDEALLFASEIQQQQIDADLVVLSSCESGVGMVIRGEGLIAMNRSFLYAGAKNVLFSLWKVNDRYTSSLMIDFYKNYMALGDYSAALRQTKLNMITRQETANPRFWAPFVLIGE